MRILPEISIMRFFFEVSIIEFFDEHTKGIS